MEWGCVGRVMVRMGRMWEESDGWGGGLMVGVGESDGSGVCVGRVMVGVG